MRLGITFDYNGKGIKAAKAGLASLLKSSIGLQVGVAGLTAAFVKLGKESVAAAVAEEKAYRVLGQTLSSAGFTQAVDGVKALIDAQQLATGVAEDQLIPAYTTLFNSLQSVSEAQAALEVAQSVSLATGKDLSSVTSAFARASKGSTTALQKLGIGLSKADLQAKSFGEILQILQNRFGGATAASIDTTSVKFDRLRIAVGEAKEEIGKGLIEAFTSAASASRTSVDQMQADIIRLGVTIGDFFRGVGGLSGAISKIEIPFRNGITNAINDGFERSYLGKFTNAFGALTGYGSALRQITEAEMAAGVAAFYMGGPRADRLSISQMGMRLLAQRYAMEEAARKKAAAAEAARKRAEEAQKKKQAALDKALAEKQMIYDSERAGIVAAMGKMQDSDTRKRLNDLLEINTAQYAQALGLTSISDIQTTIDGQLTSILTKQRSLTSAVGDTATAYANMAAAVQTAAAATALIATGRPANIIAGGNLISGGLESASNALSQFQQTIPQGTAAAAAPAAGPIYVTINESANPNDTLDAINRALRGGARQVVGL